MGKKKRTLLISMLCLVLAAIIVVVGVLGVSLSRSAYSYTDGMYAGEARWGVKIGEYTASAGVDAGNLRPKHEEYENSQRTNECFVCLATLENAGDVAATVSLGDVSVTPVMDDCGSVDHNRYSDDDIADHFYVEGLYCSKYPDTNRTSTRRPVYEMEDFMLEPGEENSVYVYAEIYWITDLDWDINNANQPYDGILGDEFDTWAAAHLESLTLTVTLRCEQAS